LLIATITLSLSSGDNENSVKKILKMGCYSTLGGAALMVALNHPLGVTKTDRAMVPFAFFLGGCLLGNFLYTNYTNIESTQNFQLLIGNALIRDENKVEISHWKKEDSYNSDINEKCSTVMQLLGSSCCSHVTKLLENKQWHHAWISVLQLMASKGLSSLTEVQDEIKLIKIEKGEDWNNLLERFQEANNKLAILTHLNNESLLPSFDLAQHKFNNEMADDNSFDKTDTEIIALHGSVLIRESTRVSNLLRSIANSDRFEFPYNEISGWKPEVKTMKKILEHLTNHDLSARGQKVFEEELASIRSSNNNGNNGPSNKKPKPDGTVLVTEQKVFSKGSCINHPDSTTHNTAGCMKGKPKPDPREDKNLMGKSWDKEEVLPGKHKCKYCIVHHHGKEGF
jgi:hypothetical protein